MVLLVTRSLPTLPRHVGPTARRALHGVTAATSRRCGVTSRPALAQLASSKQPRCLGPAVTNQMGQVRLLTGEKREQVKVLAVLYDGGKHADEVRFNPVSHFCLTRSKFPSSQNAPCVELHWENAVKASSFPIRQRGMRGKHQRRGKNGSLLPAAEQKHDGSSYPTLCAELLRH